MSPITLPRMRSVRAEKKERTAEALTSRPHGHTPYAAPQNEERRDAWAARGADSAGDERRTAQRVRLASSGLVASLLLTLASASTRHWLVEAGATLCVAGGFIAAPFLTVTAWIGLALPQRMPLHQASTALFLVAILWMAAALIGAHLHHSRRPARETGCADDGD